MMGWSSSIEKLAVGVEASQQNVVEYKEWTFEEIEEQFIKAPIREFNEQKIKTQVAGYYLSEVVSVGIKKNQLKRLIKKDVLEVLYFRSSWGVLLNFYRIKKK